MHAHTKFELQTVMSTVPSLKGEERKSIEDGVNEVQQVVSQKIERNHENIHRQNEKAQS
jgi:hypothetical protein